MLRRVGLSIVAVVSVFAAGYAGGAAVLLWLNWNRSKHPPEPALMGDLESPILAIVGIVVGLATGSMLAAVWLRRIWRAAIPEGEVNLAEVQERNDTGRFDQFGKAFLIAIGGLALLPLYLGLREIEWGWAGPATWFLPFWFAANVVAPLGALYGVGWLVKKNQVSRRIVYVAAVLMAAIILLLHVSAKYQMTSGEPNGTYVIGLVVCCVGQWGLWLITVSVLLGLRLGAVGKSRPNSERRRRG